MMFTYMEDTCLAEEVQMDQVPLTPTIVVCGQSCFSAKRWMLSVDPKIVQPSITSFIPALCLMFGFCVFNIHYPVVLASMLEFLQRCFFSINLERGTKVEKISKSRLHVNLSDHECSIIHPLSLSLIHPKTYIHRYRHKHTQKQALHTYTRVYVRLTRVHMSV